ncbi:MAG: membrane protein insertion efficiency factor YidD [Cellvibrionaceae bacterium]
MEKNLPKAKVFKRESCKGLMLLPRKLAIQCIRGYQLVASPWVGNQCRFTPTCSHYAIEAYQQKGFIKGTFLSLKRIVKCNPWHKGGIDEVPK